MSEQPITGETLLDLLGRIKGPWSHRINDDGDLIVSMGDDHELVFGNMEGSCSLCHANQELAALAPILAREVLDLREILFTQHDSPMTSTPMMSAEEWRNLSAASRAEINRQGFLLRGRLQAMGSEIVRLSKPRVNDDISIEAQAQGWTLEKIIGLQFQVNELLDVLEKVKHFWQSWMDDGNLKLLELTATDKQAGREIARDKSEV